MSSLSSTQPQCKGHKFSRIFSAFQYFTWMSFALYSIFSSWILFILQLCGTATAYPLINHWFCLFYGSLSVSFSFSPSKLITFFLLLLLKIPSLYKGKLCIYIFCCDEILFPYFAVFPKFFKNLLPHIFTPIWGFSLLCLSFILQFLFLQPFTLYYNFPFFYIFQNLPLFYNFLLINIEFPQLSLFSCT